MAQNEITVPDVAVMLIGRLVLEAEVNRSQAQGTIRSLAAELDAANRKVTELEGLLEKPEPAEIEDDGFVTLHPLPAD